MKNDNGKDRAPRRLLRRGEVEQMVGLAVTAIYGKVKAGTFPAPRRLPGSAAVRWDSWEIEDWIDALTPTRSAPAPKRTAETA